MSIPVTSSRPPGYRFRGDSLQYSRPSLPAGPRWQLDTKRKLTTAEWDWVIDNANLIRTAAYRALGDKSKYFDRSEIFNYAIPTVALAITRWRDDGGAGLASYVYRFVYNLFRGPHTLTRLYVAPSRRLKLCRGQWSPPKLAGNYNFGDYVDDASRKQLSSTDDSQLAVIREWVDGDDLTARQRQAVGLYFGFEPGCKMTLKSVATVMGISRERVRQLIGLPLARLRRRLGYPESPEIHQPFGSRGLILLFAKHGGNREMQRGKRGPRKKANAG